MTTVSVANIVSTLVVTGLVTLVCYVSPMRTGSWGS